MSISFYTVEKRDQNEEDPFYFTSGFIRATINPKIVDCSPLPKDYSLFPCYLPKNYLKYFHQIQNFEVRSDDVWVVSFPKVKKIYQFEQNS